MGAGESFGEIALLRRIPRTATVTAMSRLEVRTLAREEFLAAVTGNPGERREGEGSCLHPTPGRLTRRAAAACPGQAAQADGYLSFPAITVPGTG